MFLLSRLRVDSKEKKHATETQNKFSKHGPDMNSEKSYYLLFFFFTYSKGMSTLMQNTTLEIFGGTLTIFEILKIFFRSILVILYSFLIF